MRVLVIILFQVVIPVWATTIGGVLSSNTYLDSSNNPYYVTSDLQVPTGIELHVGPGVVMLFSEGMSVKVGGLLRMEGTQLDPIQLSPEPNASKWGGLIFYDSAIDFDTATQTGCFVNYIHSTKGGGATGHDIYNFSNGYTVKALLSTVTVRNSVFEDNVGSGLLFTQGGYFQSNEIFGQDFRMEHVLGDSRYMYFEDNYIHDITAVGYSSVFSTGRSVIKRNIFKNCNYHPAIINVSNECIITDNEITNCPDSWGIILLGGLYHTISNNTFENTRTHIMQSCERYPTVTDNCFGHFQDYAVLVSANLDLFYPYGPFDCQPYGSIVTIDYSTNYFLGADSLSVQDMIYDYYDDIGDLFICDVYPMNSSCSDNTFSIEDYENNLFTVFPNPVQDYLNVQLTEGFENGLYKAELINNLGQVVYSRSFENGPLYADVSAYKQGIYHLIISDQKRNIKAVEKIVICR